MVGDNMKVKDICISGIVEEYGQVIVKVVLEDDDGHTDEFGIDLWEMLDTEKFAEVLYRWKTHIMPMRKKVHNLIKVKKDIQTVQEFIEALKGITIERTDTSDAIKSKVLKKVQNVLDKIEWE